MNYEIRYVRGHVEVYDQMGRFRFSADSEWEALGEGEPHPPASTQTTRPPRIAGPRLPI